MNNHARMTALSSLVEDAHRINGGQPGEDVQYNYAKATLTGARSLFTTPAFGPKWIVWWFWQWRTTIEAIQAMELYLIMYGRGLRYVERSPSRQL